MSEAGAAGAICVICVFFLVLPPPEISYYLRSNLFRSHFTSVSPLMDEGACVPADGYVAGEKMEFFVADADGGVCGACGAVQDGAVFCGAAAAGDLRADEGECGAAGGAAVGVAVVAEVFSHGFLPWFLRPGCVRVRVRFRGGGLRGVCRVLRHRWFHTPVSRF